MPRRFAREGGAIDALVAAVDADRSSSKDAERLADAVASGADVLFAHEPAVAERLLEVRRPGQQVWLMMHAPMPIGLDMAWSWGLPEWDWQVLATLPDTRRWIEWELDVCAGVDRLITPCPEAVGELARVDARFARPAVRLRADRRRRAARRHSPARPARSLRRRWRLPARRAGRLVPRAAALPYRGLDRLMDAAAVMLPASVRGCRRGRGRRTATRCARIRAFARSDRSARSAIFCAPSTS